MQLVFGNEYLDIGIQLRYIQHYDPDRYCPTDMDYQEHPTQLSTFIRIGHHHTYGLNEIGISLRPMSSSSNSFIDKVYSIVQRWKYSNQIVSNLKRRHLISI